MCGIAGVCNCNSNKAKVGQEVLKKMSDIIYHRGPDSDGQWISESGRCGFSFRRLAIVDLSPKGNQPMRSLNAPATIVFNGEVYNHQEIRNSLIELGYKYDSQTDTETILNGYLHYGEELLPKMLGMWGFAIWNDDTQELFCARDRIGIKPFYYYYKDGLFVFGSEIKSILEHPEVRKEFNIEELPNYLNYGMSSSQESLFKNIKKLPAGHCLKINRNGEMTIKRYWSPFERCGEDFKMSEEEIFEELITLLRRSVKDRMMSDVPFGVFLSGGIDSSLNVALMSELMNRPVDTFTVGFKALEKYNELEYARQIADRYKTNHKEILIDQNDSFEVLEKLPWYEDEPNADPVCIPLYFLSKLTRESGTIVVQVGEGSDEQFCGYKWMMRDLNFHNSYWKTFKSVPKFMQKAAYSVGAPILNARNLQQATDYMRRAVNDEELYWSGTSVFSPTNQMQMFSGAHKRLANIPAQYSASMYAKMKKLYPNADQLQKMLYVELTQRLAEMLLMRVDKIGMAHSIEARVPFLDHRIVEYTMSIPQRLKVPNNKTTKYLLKKAVEPILPHDIIYRKKQGFAAPVKEWLKSDWFEYAKHNLLNSEFSKLGIIDKSYISNLLNKHKSGEINGGAQIYSLLNLNLWYKAYWN
jgi:asparagine synthase (glutamine-hydrolysing)